VPDHRDLPPAIDALDALAGDHATDDATDATDDIPADLQADEDGDLLSNAALAQVFHEIGDLLEVKGELVFKTVAYHRAADAIGRSPVEVARAYRDGSPPDIPGVGKAIADKLAELARTGRSEYHQRLLAEFPPTLLDLLRIPGLGPKSVRQIYTSLGIATLDELKAAAESGRLRGLRGMSNRTEDLILKGIAGLETGARRMLLHRARAIIDDVVAVIEGIDGVDRVIPAGSYRRRKETIGDLDFLAEADVSAEVVDHFAALPSVAAVINQGPAKAAVEFGGRGPQIDLMLMPPGQAGTYLVHFTGSKEHNVRLRARARDRGWSLSEKGFLRIGEDGQPLAGDAAELRTFATEEEV
jgi:DNA polymerase (family 10)